MNQSYFVINSDDRDKVNYPDPSDYKVVGNDQSFSAENVGSLEATEFSMYYDVPNINLRNNVMLVDDGGSSYPLTVKEGFYTHATLATALQVELILALGAGQSVVFDPVKQRYTMTTTVPIKYVKYPLQVRDLTDVMGFNKNKPLSLVNVSGSSDLVYTRNIYVKSNSIHRSKTIQDQSTTSILTDLLMTVPIYESGSLVSEPQQIAYQVSWPKKIYVNSQDRISSFDLQLLDDQGEHLYNPNVGLNTWKYHINIIATKGV